MIRLFAIVVGLALIGYPPFLIHAISVPVPRFRTGSYVDFLTFAAGVWGALAVGVVFLAGAGVRGLTTQGWFEKGIGNLWGLVLILAAVLGALVSGGAADQGPRTDQEQSTKDQALKRVPRWRVLPRSGDTSLLIEQLQ